eukprot:779348_1
MIKQELRKCDDEQINSIFHNVFPIDQILPQAIIQKILSYDQYSVNNKAVSKSFQKLSEKNDKIVLKERDAIIKYEKIMYNINDKHFNDPTKNYWIVDKNRQELTNEEIGLGYKGPISTIMTAIKKCAHGDTLLIHDG